MGIVMQLTTLDPYKSISFVRLRMRKRKVLLLLPELATFDLFLAFCANQNLKFEMEIHNKTVRRGMRMGLIATFDSSKLIYLVVHCL